MIILKNNRNITYNVISCLEFVDKYNLCITNKNYFENKFKKYKHQELVKIKFKDYLLTKKWLNIKFQINLYKTYMVYVSMLGHALYLSYCQNITDVLMSEHTLNLEYCKNISQYQNDNLKKTVEKL